MAHTYQTVRETLRQAYNQSAHLREASKIAPWKIAIRDGFLDRLQAEGKTRLLEIGAGPGKYGQYFQTQGLQVICTDLSPEMVRLCRAKGLEAHVMDFLNLDFPAGHFEAVFALNCLLHVPKSDLPQVLATIATLLAPDGLFFLGTYGGSNFEGIWDEDKHEPKRFFAYYSNADLQALLSQYFEIVSFESVDIPEGRGEFHFQAVTLRLPIG